MANIVSIGDTGLQVRAISGSTSSTTSSFGYGNVHVPARYGYYSHGAASQTVTGSGFVKISIDGTADKRENASAGLWNTTTSTFFPTAIDKAYDVRVTGIARVTDPGANPSLICVMAISGTGDNAPVVQSPTMLRRHRVHANHTVRSGSTVGGAAGGGQHGDPHFEVNYLFFSDADLLASGAQLFMSLEAIGAASTNPVTGSISIVSASILIVERW